MLALLLGHGADCRVGRRALGQHRELAVIDAARAVLAGMVDPDDALDQLARIGVARQAVLSCARSRTGVTRARRRTILTRVHAALRIWRRAPVKVMAASTSEAIRLKPAIEMPPSCQAMSVQRTTGAAMIWARSASIELGVPASPHWAVPCHQPCSTPTWNAAMPAPTRKATPASPTAPPRIERPSALRSKLEPPSVSATIASAIATPNGQRW